MHLPPYQLLIRLTAKYFSCSNFIWVAVVVWAIVRLIPTRPVVKCWGHLFLFHSLCKWKRPSKSDKRFRWTEAAINRKFVKYEFLRQNHLSVSWKNPLKEIILYCFNLKSWKIITFMGKGLVGCHRWSTLLIGIIPFFMCVWSVTLWCILAVMFQFSECKPFASLFLRFS